MRLPTIPSLECVHQAVPRPSEREELIAWQRQLSPCSVISVASSGRLYGEPAQTLLFLDWDDTMFPCTELFCRMGHGKRVRDWVAPLCPQLDEALKPWRQAVEEFLRQACAVSDRCVIVTNSRPPWVTACVDHFAPNLKPLFEQEYGPTVVYASELMKQQVEPQPESLLTKALQHLQNMGLCFSFTEKLKLLAGAGGTNPRPLFDLTEAKLLAMKREAEHFYSQYQGQTWKNIISLGDMAYEYEACKTLTATRVAPQDREKLRTKSVVLLPSPQLSTLTLQLQIWTQLLPFCVRFDGDLDLDLGSSFAPFEDLARALRIPGLAKLPAPRALQPLGLEEDLEPKENENEDEENENEENEENENENEFAENSIDSIESDAIEDLESARRLVDDRDRAEQLLDQLPILLDEAAMSPPKETFMKAR